MAPIKLVLTPASRLTNPMVGRLLLTLILASSCLRVLSSGHHGHQHHHQHHSQHPSQQQYQQHQPQQPYHHPQQSHQQPPQQNPLPHEQNGIAPAHQHQPVVPQSSNSGKMLASGALLGAASAAAGAATAAAIMPHHQHHELPEQQSGNDQQNLLRPTRHLNVEKKFIDLSHPLSNATLHWPALADISYNVLREGEFNNTQGRPYFLKSDSLNSAIHSGTHMDAPRHFSKTGWTVDQIPLHRLIDVPLSVIDVSAKVKANRSYNFVRADFLDPKTSEPLVQPNSVVLVYTGISQMYDQGKEAYLGTASNNLNEMKIPGFSEDAANFMVEIGVYGVGLDSVSADSSDRHGSEGPESYDPVAHTILNTRNIYIIENINKNLADLVSIAGARLTVAPLPIVDGSGSQVRLVAITGHDECHCEAQPQLQPKNASSGSHQYSGLTFLISLILCLAIFFM